MADEGLTGTAPVVPPEGAPKPEAPATPQAPPAQTPQTPSPQGGGKTAEQLSAELDEQSNLLRDYQDRMARLEHENNLARQMYDSLTAGRTPKEEQESPAITDDEFLASPGKALTKMFESFSARERAEREKERASTYIENARRAFESGREAAMKENKDLFRGIENTVATEMLNNVRDSFRAGQPVDVSVLENPRYHLAAALAMRVMNGDDMGKYFGPKTTNPMAPVHTETPSAGGPPQAGINLSAEQMEIISRAGIKPEQFEESIRKVRAASQEMSK